MMFPISEIVSEDELISLVSLTKDKLDNHKIVVLYPDIFSVRKGLEVWRAFSKFIDEDNRDLLTGVTNKSGVYAIYEELPEGKIHLRYVGQTNKRGARQRIRSHLVWRNKNTTSGKYTGSKFDEVVRAVNSGHQIYFSFCEISPPALRHYVEEKLFENIEDGWNQHQA